MILTPKIEQKLKIGMVSVPWVTEYMLITYIISQGVVPSKTPPGWSFVVLKLIIILLF